MIKWQALGLNKTLRRLKLDWNSLDERCFAKIAEGHTLHPCTLNHAPKRGLLTTYYCREEVALTAYYCCFL